MRNIQQRLEIFLSNKNAVDLYQEAVAMLDRIELSDLLRHICLSKIVMQSDPNSNLTQAAWAQGFNDAIEHIFRLDEIYGSTVEDRKQKQLQPDYGGLEEAVLRGDLSKAEAEKLR